MSETQQTRVVAVLDDMFFSSKIKEAAKQAEVSLEIIKKTDEIIQVIQASPTKLIIVDLNNRNLDPLALIKDIKSRSALRGIPTVGFLPHVEEDLKNKAIEAGFDSVMPRSRFSRELVKILHK